MSANAVPYQVESYQALANEMVIIRLLPASEQRLNYQAGQYLELTIDGDMRMAYSMANAPQADGSIKLNIRSQINDLHNQQLLNYLKSMPIVKVYGPFGNCSYENWLPISTLLIAVGSGFAQVQAWLEAASLAQHSRLIHLYWIVRNEQDQYQIERLEHWQTELNNFHYELIYTTEVEQSVIELLQLSLQSRYPNLNDYQVYASGPPQLVHEIKDALRACCNLEHFHADV